MIKTLIPVMSDPHATWPLIAAASLRTRDLLLHTILPFASVTATAVTLGVLVFSSKSRVRKLAAAISGQVACGSDITGTRVLINRLSPRSV